MKSVWARISVTLFLFLMIMSVAIWLLKDRIAEYAYEKAANKMAAKGLTLTRGGLALHGLNRVVLQRLVLHTVSGDTIAEIDSIDATLSISGLLSGKIRAKKLHLEKPHFHLYRTNHRDNLTPILGKPMPETNMDDLKKTPVSYASLANMIVEQAFSITPKEITVTGAYAKFHVGKYLGSVKIDTCKMLNKQFDVYIAVREGNMVSNWQVSGLVDVPDERLKISIVPKSGQKGPFPFVTAGTGAKLWFDTLSIDFNAGSLRKGKLPLTGELHATAMKLGHEKLSEQPVVFDLLDLRFDGRIGPRSIEIDDNSFVTVNALNFKIYTYFLNDSYKQLEVKVQSGPVPASTFFRSLPAGLFDHTRCVMADGELSYSMQLKGRTDDLDNLEFTSSLDREKFRIKTFCKANLPMIKDNFEFHTQDYPYRILWVGPENPSFTPIDSISSYLKNAVLTAEDGAFYKHQGFNEESIRLSIITNIEKGGFVRGGSTITMQLVKNVFLTRKKTIARKLEEVLLVWMLESGRLVSKDRMLEVYLNVIEFGPGVYGIGEAAQFYFNKSPSELTLPESIFLASIVPRPKKFMFAFDEQGKLKPYMDGYFKLITSIMVRRSLIPEGEYDTIASSLAINGAARQYLRLAVPDEGELEEEMGDQEIFLQK